MDSATARQLAYAHHRDQLDRSGRLLVEHLERVAALVDEEVLSVAYLHDLLERTDTPLAELEAEARRRWPIIEAAIVHRVGELDLGAVSVAVAVSCPHRQDAFEACRWLIDTLKDVVPIWKRENWEDGGQEWIHPGLAR